MRAPVIIFGALLASNICLADSPLPYQTQIQFPRIFASENFDGEAKRQLSAMYLNSIEKCDPNPGASYFMVITDVSSTDAEDASIATDELARVKVQMKKLGFPEAMIFTEVMQQKEGFAKISPSVIVRASCRHK